RDGENPRERRGRALVADLIVERRLVLRDGEDHPMVGHDRRALRGRRRGAEAAAAGGGLALGRERGEDRGRERGRDDQSLTNHEAPPFSTISFLRRRARASAR